MNKYAVATLLALGGLARTAVANELTINTESLGWYQSTGVHNSYNENTFTGYLSGTEYRSFFVWSLPKLDGHVTSARIDFQMPYSLGASGQTSQTGLLYDVSPANIPNLPLDNGNGHGAAIFDDLGSGTSYGSVVVPSSYYYSNYTLSVTLNSDAIAAINASSNGRFALGVKNQSASVYDYFLFSSMSARAQQNLVLNVSAVPEPDVAMLVLGGLAVAGVAVRRRRQTC